MHENDIARIVVDAAFRVHSRLGPGLLESLYERVLAYELRQRGLSVETEVPIKVIYDGVEFDEGFRADIIVEGKVILELKSVETVAAVHKKQLLTYLRVTGMRLGLLINFNEPLIKNGLSRLVNGLTD
jgi:GxxExxY protein